MPARRSRARRGTGACCGADRGAVAGDGPGHWCASGARPGQHAGRDAAVRAVGGRDDRAPAAPPGATAGPGRRGPRPGRGRWTTGRRGGHRGAGGRRAADPREFSGRRASPSGRPRSPGCWRAVYRPSRSHVRLGSRSRRPTATSRTPMGSSGSRRVRRRRCLRWEHGLLAWGELPVPRTARRS
jgi:hypothetical protein